MAVAGGVGIALEFAVNGRSVALEMGDDSVGLHSLLVQGLDLTALVVPRMVVRLSHGDFFHTIRPPLTSAPPYLVSHLLLQLEER